MDTYCPDLWDSFTIDNRGNVYSCCLIKPVCLGNIYESELRNLVNDPAIVKERENSLNGKLECYSDCNWVEKNGLPPERIADSHTEYDKMSYLHLNFGEKCNISCIMCRQRQRYSSNPWILDPEVLSKNIDLRPFTDIVIQGGEPLFIDQCLEYMRYLGGIGKKYTLLTNGLLIDDLLADQLSKDAKIVCISLNAATKKTHELVNNGSRWDVVLNNINRLKAARSRNNSCLEIWGRMTITTLSLPEIPQYLRTWKALGFDHINFGYDRRTVPSFLKNNPDIHRRLKEEVAISLANADLQMMDIYRLKCLGLVEEGV
jgi:MoaA/NifB/PqqE/SkfB family radical SAM enzyme